MRNQEPWTGSTLPEAGKTYRLTPEGRMRCIRAWMEPNGETAALLESPESGYRVEAYGLVVDGSIGYLGWRYSKNGHIRTYFEGGGA